MMPRGEWSLCSDTDGELQPWNQLHWVKTILCTFIYHIYRPTHDHVGGKIRAGYRPVEVHLHDQTQNSGCIRAFGGMRCAFPHTIRKRFKRATSKTSFMRENQHFILVNSPGWIHKGKLPQQLALFIEAFDVLLATTAGVTMEVPWIIDCVDIIQMNNNDENREIFLNIYKLSRPGWKHSSVMDIFQIFMTVSTPLLRPGCM